MTANTATAPLTRELRDLDGLSTNEVEHRRADGRVNLAPPSATRSMRAIFLGNLFTPFNVILGALLVVTLFIGPLQDAAFGLVLLLNFAIGTIQELRAKRTLDRLAVVVAPHVRVMRNGEETTIAQTDVVVDDVVALRSGEQITTDGHLIAAESLEVNEALLTGEAEPVAKRVGAALLAGSFVVAGLGAYRVSEVGGESYGQRLASEARKRTAVRSELVHGTNVLIRIIGVLLIPMGVIVAISQSSANETVVEAIRSSIAGMVTLIPQGLVLLTSVAFALAVVRLARQKVVASELAAVEPLARIDTLCIDKTGTLTTGDLKVSAIDPIGGCDDFEVGLVALAGVDAATNATAAALQRAFDRKVDRNQISTSVPFSSSRRWSGVTLRDGTTWIMGAPEIIGVQTQAEWQPLVASRTASGERVILLCRCPHPVTSELPRERTVVAVIGLREHLREGVRETVAYLQSQGIRIMVLSGDNPQTVSTVARHAGIDAADSYFDATHLSGTSEVYREELRSHAVFGRVDPHRKLQMVHALQDEGHVVGMVGDGVNDVLALRDADLGIAMGSGSSASRGIARLVLLDGTLAALPLVIGEGRRLLANVERAASLFVTKTVFAAVLILGAAWAALPFPLLLRQLTVVDAVAIGIPGFVLTLVRSNRPWRRGYLARVSGIAIPAGLIIGITTAVAYETALHDLNEPLLQARSLAAVALTASVLWLVYHLVADHRKLATSLCVTMAAAFVAFLLLPWGRDIFAFAMPSKAAVLVAIGAAAVSTAGIGIAARVRRSMLGPV